MGQMNWNPNERQDGEPKIPIDRRHAIRCFLLASASVLRCCLSLKSHTLARSIHRMHTEQSGALATATAPRSHGQPDEEHKTRGPASFIACRHRHCSAILRHHPCSAFVRTAFARRALYPSRILGGVNCWFLDDIPPTLLNSKFCTNFLK
jgi:hypothetical protein